MSPLEKTVIKMKKILLVDPNEETRGENALRLELLELEVLQATTAAEALEQLDQKPQLVVTDLPLTGEAGEFYEKLKRAKMPVVFFNSRPGEDLEPFRAKNPASVRVSKFNRKEMLDQVSKFLAGEIPPGPVGSSGNGRKPRQILVVEDSLTLRGLVRRVLEKYFPEDEIREAEDGRQAMGQMSQKKVDLIITDLEMPGMDGLTFLNHLKNNPLLSRKPVLVFSGNISEELRNQAVQMTNLRFLPKPATPEKIAAEV